MQMTDQPVSLFINPTAGRGRAAERLRPIQDAFAAAAIPLNVHTSDAVGSMEREVALQVSNGAAHIIAIGGDGSVNECVNGIQQAGKESVLSAIPSGTGNDFAKACDISLDWKQATHALIERIKNNAAPRRIDLGCVNDRFFANGVGIGIDAKATRIARSIRWPIGNLVYLAALLRCLYDGVATPELQIHGTDVEFRGPVTLATICNGPWVGGIFHIAPTAVNSDGRMDLLIADPVSRPRVLGLLPKLMRGQHLQEPEISHQLIDKLIVTSVEPIECHIDGEVQAPQVRFEIKVLSGALHLL